MVEDDRRRPVPDGDGFARSDDGGLGQRRASTIWSTFQRIMPGYESAGAGPSASL
jgi:hypothetical protein